MKTVIQPLGRFFEVKQPNKTGIKNQKRHEIVYDQEQVSSRSSRGQRKKKHDQPQANGWVMKNEGYAKRCDKDDGQTYPVLHPGEESDQSPKNDQNQPGHQAGLLP